MDTLMITLGLVAVYLGLGAICARWAIKWRDEGRLGIFFPDSFAVIMAFTWPSLVVIGVVQVFGRFMNWLCGVRR